MERANGLRQFSGDSSRVAAPSDRHPTGMIPTAAVVAILILASIAGTVLSSMTTISERGVVKTVEIEADGIYAEKHVMLGYGEFSFSCLNTRAHTLIIALMSEDDFSDFLSEASSNLDLQSWDSIFQLTVGTYHYAEVSFNGFMSSGYLVIASAYSFGPVTVEFEVNKDVYVSLPWAAAFTTLSATVGTALVMFRMPRELASMRHVAGSRRSATVFRAKAALWCAALAVIGTVWIFLRTPFPGRTAIYSLQIEPLGVGGFDWYIEVPLAILAAAFLMQFKLTTVGCAPDRAISDIAHRLRVSGHLVRSETYTLRVRTSTVSELRIRAHRISDGSVIVVQGRPTPGGWAAVGLLLGVSYGFITAFFAVAVTIVILYGSLVFARTRVLPRVVDSPSLDQLTPRERTFRLMVASLAEGHRIASEAAEAAMSRYNDRVLANIIPALAIWGVAIIMGAGCDHILGTGFIGYVSLAAGAVIAAAFFRASHKRLRTARYPTIEELRGWSWRLGIALGELSVSGHVLEDEHSMFELVTESYRRLPDWLSERGRARSYVSPVHWLSILGTSIAAVVAAVYGLNEIVAYTAVSIPAFLASGGFALCAIFILRRWRQERNRDFEETLSSCKERIAALDAKMEKFMQEV